MSISDKIGLQGLQDMLLCTLLTKMVVLWCRERVMQKGAKMAVLWCRERVMHRWIVQVCNIYGKFGSMVPQSGGGEAKEWFDRLTGRCRQCLVEGDGRQLGGRLQQLRHGEAPTPVVLGPAGSAHLKEQLLCRAQRELALVSRQRCGVAAVRLQPRAYWWLKT